MKDSTPDFTRLPLGRFEWERILRRVQVSVPSVKLVGFAMATYANSDGTRVRPGQKRLSAVLGASEMTVRRGQAELEALGLLEMVFKGHSQGRGQSGGYASEYRLTVPSDLLERVPMLDPDEAKHQTPTSGDSQKDRTPMSGEYEEIPDTGEEIPDTHEETPDIRAEIPDTHVPPPEHSHHIKDHNINHQSMSLASSDAQAREPKQGEIEIYIPADPPRLSKAAFEKQLAEEFNDWYAIYPKHTGRGAAVNSYTKARKKGATAEDLMAGAKRYAAERKGQEHKFTAAPATWLNQERWTDEPEHMGEIDVTAILGKDYWTPGPPPASLSVSEEIAWKKDQRAARTAQRLEEAKAKAASKRLSPWDPAFHEKKKVVPRQYEWCNQTPAEEQSA